MLGSTRCYAEAINVSDALKNLPEVKEGVVWDFQHKRFLNTLGLEVLTWKGINANLSWIGTDGVGATVAYSLDNLPIQNVPILKYTSYLNVGYTAGYRTLTLSDVNDNPKSDNQFIQGPTLFCKLHF